MRTSTLRRRSAGMAVFSFVFLLLASTAWLRAQPADGPGSLDSPPPAAASEEAPAGNVREEILVTATHPELPPIAAELSGSELTAAPGKDLAETLRTLPGAGSARRGPLNLDPLVRGLSETEVLTTVDGTRTFAAGPARMDSELSHVSPHAIERLQVVKGPYALTWGAGALAAIALETLRPTFGPQQPRATGNLDLGYKGNVDASDAFASLWGSSERWRYGVSVGAREGGDYRSGGDGATVPGDYRSQDTRWVLGFRPTDNLVLDLTGGYQEQHDVDYPGRILDANYFYTRSHSLEATWAPQVAGLDEVYGQVYVNRKDHLMNNDEKPTALPQPGRVPPFGIDVHLPTQSDSRGARLRLDGSRGDLGWKAGGDSYHLQQSATRTISRRDNGIVLFVDRIWPDATIDATGLYGQLEWRGPWTVAGTVRVDRVEADAVDPTAFFLANTHGALAQSDLLWNAAASARGNLGSGWSLSVGAGRALRAPNVLERYSDRFPASKFQTAAEFLGDPELRPEAASQLDVALGRTTARASLEVSLYYRRVEDYITVQPDPTLPRRLPLSPPTVYRYVNGKADFYGGEAQLAHRPVSWLNWRASLEWIHGEDKAFHEPAFGMPPPTARLDLRFLPGSRWWIDLGGIAVQRQDRIATARLEKTTPGYAVFNLGAGTSLGERWRLKAGVENVGDRRYATHLNSLNPFTGERIPEPGRSVYAGVEMKF